MTLKDGFPRWQSMSCMSNAAKVSV